MDAIYYQELTGESDKNSKTGGKMKRRYLIFIMYWLLLTGILYGCGSGPGSPGSSGTEDTGVELDATIVGTYNGADTYSVDAFQDLCDAGPPPVFEVFTDHGATVTITARRINPTSTFTPGKLHIQKYTIKYVRSNDSIGAPPIESDTRFVSIDITPPAGAGTTTTTASILLVDLIRKDQYWTDVTSGQYSSDNSLNNYTAIYTFEGQNDFGTHFSFEVHVPFQIADFLNC
jgi:hypothetical protein